MSLYGTESLYEDEIFEIVLEASLMSKNQPMIDQCNKELNI